MKSQSRFDGSLDLDSHELFAGNAGAVPACALHLISRFEAKHLRDALDRGEVPGDLRSKLRKLEQGEVIHHFIRQNSQLIIALLQAAHDGEFQPVDPTEYEHLLRVLAYVRKDDDLIPDYQPGGYTDDHQVMRAIVHELAPLLQRFKLWRLRHQVPGMWLSRWDEPGVGRFGAAASGTREHA